MAKLDDLFSKKKETTPILDLSKSVVKSADDFKKLMEKVPEYKIKPEKVRSEDVKLRDKDFKFKTGKKDFKAMNETYLFMDPIPSEMKELKLKDFISIPIDWHMLTTLRPKTKSDEEYFSKIVELGKAEMRTVARDKRIFAQDSLVRKSKNKSGVVEQRIVSCSECGEEYCTGKVCMQFGYDYFARQPESSTTVQKTLVTSSETKKKKKIKRKGRSKSKSRKKSPSKSPKKSTTRK
ncbi:uncharacterized protein [Onthophagus taurus]|uniref:uncharacterized protein n=1 Tax=Onthophagus taurus TaxID=166361 RepID=UPI0039BE8D50